MKSDIQEIEDKFDTAMRCKFNIAFKCLEQIGIHPGQCHMISFIMQNPGKNQKEIAEMLNIAPATVTIMTKKLEKAGFIERVIDSRDQRVMRIHITDSGKDIYNKMSDIKKRILHESYKDFTDEELEMTKHIIDKMINNIKSIPDDIMFIK